jgi:hypothetical protein
MKKAGNGQQAVGGRRWAVAAVHARATVVGAGLLAVVGMAACAHKMPSIRRAAVDKVWPESLLDTTRRIAVVDAFTGPEAVRYDPDQDLYFVANFGSGETQANDNNGFISLLRPDGSLMSLRFIAGGEGGVTLHAPRGMTIVADTLWVADNGAVRGFNRLTGRPVASIDMTSFGAGFLNDIAAGPGGVLYVTDTPKNRVYRVFHRTATIAVEDSTLNSPNGITWDDWNSRFVIVPYGGSHALLAWSEGNPLTPFATSTGGKFDGIEFLGPNDLLVASQADSSLHRFVSGTGRPVIRTSGKPADIALDTKRMRVAVPSIALNRVEIWQLPRIEEASADANP